MLQVTFRDLPPSEDLLSMASAWYARVCKAKQAPHAPLSCHIVISDSPGVRAGERRYRVLVETGSAVVAPAFLAEASTPEVALQNATAGSEAAQPVFDRLAARWQARSVC